MAEDTKAKKQPEEGKQVEPMPSSEKKTPGTSAGEGVAPKGEEAPAPEEGKEEPGLPKGVKKRTKQQFDKLKKQLADYRQRLFQEQTHKAMKPKPAPEKKEKEKPLYDPKTGLVDVNELERLRTRTSEAEARASKAEDAVQSYIETTQTREAYNAHPELNPKSDKFDEGLHVSTRRILMDSMVYPDSYGGRQITYKEAADLASKGSKEAVKKAKEEGAKQAKEALTPKEQASLEATGRSDRRAKTRSNLKDLRKQTREGDLEAVVQRMKNVEATKKEKK